MAEKERDWDKEMKEVDKLLAKLPAADPYLVGSAPTVRKPAAHAPAAGGGGPGAAPARAHERLGTWLRVGLGVLLTLGMAAWPYSHQCGLRLIFYMIGVGTVVVAGAWSAISSWRRRLGLAHVVSLVVTLWGLTLTAGIFGPRIYATPTALWLCPEPPAPPRH